MERDARSIARRQELMQSGLSLGPTNSAPPVNNVKRETGPPVGLFSLGNSALKSRVPDVNKGIYGEKGDFGLKVNSFRRDMDVMDPRVGPSGGLHFDARLEGRRSPPAMPTLAGESKSGVPLPHFRQGPSMQHMQQRLNSPGPVLNFTNNHHLREGPPTGLFREASPGSLPGSLITVMPPTNISQLNMKPSPPTPHRTPPRDRESNKGQVLVAAPSSAQYQALQQQALHQQTLHQQAPQQHNLQAGSQQLSPQQLVTLHQATMYKGGASSPPPSSGQQQMTMSQLLAQQSTLQQNCAMKLEPLEMERTPLFSRSSPYEWASPIDQASVMDRGSMLDRSSHSHSERSVVYRETPEASDVDEKKGVNVERSKLSVSPGESRDSGARLGGDGQGGGKGGGRYSTGYSGRRSSREGVFADLNAEPPASDGEEDGAGPSDGLAASDGLPPVAQPESSRTTPDEKKKRTKPSKEQKKFNEWEEDLKKGLIHVSRKFPKNAHAQFTLGLMHQRLGQHLKAAAAYEKAAEVLKQTETETGNRRGQILATVQNHLSQGNIGNQLRSGKELEKEEIEGLLRKLQEVSHTDFGKASIWNTLGLLLLRTGRIKSAITVFTSLLQVVPDHLDALANLGVAYFHSGELERAARCIQMVLDKDPNHPGALINFGALLVRKYGSTFAGAGAGGGKGAYATQLVAANMAQQCLQAALKDDASAGHVWVNLAAAFSISQNMESASRCLQQATKLEPSRMSTRFAIASHRVRDADRSEDPAEQLSFAANEMASILREGDPATIQQQLAWAGLAMVNRAQHEQAASFEDKGVNVKEVEDRAIQTLQQAIMEDPEDAVPWHQLGLHTLCTLQFGLAQQYFKTAIARRPTSALTWSNLGIALQLSEDPSKAEGVYEKALELAPPEQAHSVYNNLGNLYRQQRRFAEAHSAYSKALDLCPEYAPACNNLGLLFITEDRFDEAISSFDRALAADPYLDAAKSNRMKAVALAQIRKGSTISTLKPSPDPRPLLQSDNVLQPSEAPILEANAVTAPSSFPCSPVKVSPKREPISLPSIT